MSAYPVLRTFTLQEYLKLERASKTRNEYLDGQIYAMAGGTGDHSSLIVNTTILLGIQLRGGNCRVFSSDLRIATSENGAQFYPDLTVICGGPRYLNKSSDCALNPIVVFEVSSKSTHKYDQEIKTSYYKQMPSVRHIVLMSQDAIEVEHHFLNQETWAIETLRDPDATLHLAAVGATLPVSAIYE